MGNRADVPLYQNARRPPPFQAAASARRALVEPAGEAGEVIACDVGGPVLPPCDRPLSALRISPVYRAGLELLRRWIAEGAAPPASRWIELDEAGEVVRDDLGNARGGVRLPPIKAPTGQQLPGNSGPGPCLLAGTFLAFDEPTLEVLYPSHGSYLMRVVRAARQGARDGFLLWPDAVAYIVEAARDRRLVLAADLRLPRPVAAALPRGTHRL